MNLRTLLLPGYFGNLRFVDEDKIPADTITAPMGKETYKETGKE